MHLRHRTTCRVCGNAHLKPVIDLGEQFLQGSFVKQGLPVPPLRRIPMNLVLCDVSQDENACGLLQLRHSVPTPILYGNYWYGSGTNETMRNHLKGIVESALTIVRPDGGRALDIGCNDGTLLNAYGEGWEKWGVDPSDIARKIAGQVNVVNTVFPSLEAAHRIGDRTFDCITSIAMFYDLDDPVDFVRNVAALLSAEGIWILEVAYLPLMLRMNAFDSICHEHLEYYSLAVLEHIARKCGLGVFRASLNGINGGTIRCYLARIERCGAYQTAADRAFLTKLRIMEFGMRLDEAETYQSFHDRIKACRARLQELFAEIRNRNETVHVYGASTKGNVLLQWYGLSSADLPYAADRNPDKVGARTLGTDIAIISEEESRARKPDYYLVLPWHFRAEFLRRERATVLNGTKMIFPLPEVEVVSADTVDRMIATADAADAQIPRVLGLHDI